MGLMTLRFAVLFSDTVPPILTAVQNPQNWPVGLKHSIAFQLCLLNFAVYIASSIYVPGEASLVAEFGVSDIVATLGLSLFTL